MLLDDDIALTGVNYKYSGAEQYLSGIQLDYSDGNSSPIFQNENAADEEFNEIRVSASAAPRKIAMAIDNSIGGIVGFRLADRRGNVIVEEKWNGDGVSSSWDTQDIGSRERIIGVKVSTQSDDNDFNII